MINAHCDSVGMLAAGLPIAPDVTAIAYASVAAQPLASVAVIEKLYVPTVVGVPVIEPVAGFSDSPVGSAPLETMYAYGAVPPLADTVWL